MGLLGLTLLVVGAHPGLAGVTRAYRLTDLDLRDPHVLVDFLGCRDITDTPLVGFSFNGSLQTSIQTDSEADGKLDLSLLIIFDPFDPQAVSVPARFGPSSCSAPMASTVCGPEPGDPVLSMTASNAPSGQCLGVLAGTTAHSYTPAITSANSPCFFTNAQTLTLTLNGIPFTLLDARIAATYSAPPTHTLVNGLLRGFLTQAVANNTIIPASYALIGGKPLSELFAGGDPPGSGINCASWSDMDLGPDGVTPGWWMYFNFTASSVPYTGPQLDTPVTVPRPFALTASPSPFRSSVAIEYSLMSEGPARVAVYDLVGREIATLGDEPQAAGPHRLTWNGHRADGAPAPPGLYAIRVSSGGESSTRMVVRVQ